MASILPFKGIRYNPEMVPRMELVIAPPYDVIDHQTQDNLYKKSKYNIIRLEYGKETPQDSDAENKYTRAARYFRQWLQDGVLRKEHQPCLYWYEQQYSLKNRQLTRSGLIAGVKLEPYEKKVVLPHEETLSKPKTDRLKLLQACQANFSPVFGLFIDEQHRLKEICTFVKAYEPVINFKDDSGQTHRLWKFEDTSVMANIQSFFARKQILIADGHHRYETALEYSREMKAKGKNGYDHILMTLVNLYDPGLIILPTHRVIQKIEGFHLESVLSLIQRDFDILPLHHINNLESLMQNLRSEGEDKTAFAMYAGKNYVYLLTEKKEAGEYPYRTKLDVLVLQELILERVFGISPDKRREESNLAYTKDEQEAVSLVDEGKAQAAFLLNPPKVEQVVEVARSGKKMPQKSTFFFPKLVTGLVIFPCGTT